MAYVFEQNFGFNFLTNSYVKGVTSKDSKNFHVMVLSCNNMNFDGFTIQAPGDSPNTDGIHIARSTGVTVANTNIATGDDCISMGDGITNITIENVSCGPGPGISVGSLGKYENEKPVSNVHVRNCRLTGTQNGVRIKTWPGTDGAITVSDMHFEDIVMNNVQNPVIIDQEYCPWNTCDKSVCLDLKPLVSIYFHCIIFMASFVCFLDLTIYFFYLHGLNGCSPHQR